MKGGSHPDPAGLKDLHFSESIVPANVRVAAKSNRRHLSSQSGDLWATDGCPVEVGECVSPYTEYSRPLVEWELRSGYSFSADANPDGSPPAASCCVCQAAALCFDEDGEYIGDTIYSRVTENPQIYAQWCLVLRDHYAELFEGGDAGLVSCDPVRSR